MIDKLTPREFQSDQDERLTPPTAFIDALNITVDTNEDGNAGVVKKIKGNAVVANGYSGSLSYASETIEVQGTCRDPERGRTYLFVRCATDANKHAILQYADSNNTLTLLLKGSVLDFQANNAVCSSVVNGYFRGAGSVNSILYFTDDYNEPRKINVDQVGEYTSAAISTADLKKKLAVIKSCGTRPPVGSMIRDEELGVSNFGKGGFQFAVQYIYKDGEVSALSPYSNYVFARERHDPDIAASELPNVCNITLPYTLVNEDVRSVRLLYRENNGVEISPFRIIDEFDPRKTVKRNIGDFADYKVFEAYGNKYSFINDGHYGFLPSFQEDNPFSAVPLFAKTQAVINSRLVYGNYVDGFQNLGEERGAYGLSGEAPNVALEVFYEAEPTSSSTEYKFPYNVTSDAFPYESTGDFDTITSGTNTVTVGLNSNSKIYITDSAPTTISAPNTVSLNWTMPAGNDLFLYDIGSSLNKFFSLTADGETLDHNTLTKQQIFSSMVSFNASVEIAEDSDLDDVLDLLNHELSLQQVHIESDLNFIEKTVNGKTYKIHYEFDLLPKLFVESTNTVFMRLIVKDVNVWRVQQTAPSADEHIPTSQSSGLSQAGVDQGAWGVEQSDAATWQPENRKFSIAKQDISSGFTSGSNHSFAIAYMDKYGRYGSAQEIGSTFVHPLGSAARYIGGSWYNGPASIKITPTHEPPGWAERYALLYAGPDDVKELHDLYVDDATKVVQKTKFFKGDKPNSVFLDITSYVENLRHDGLEFTSLYKPEPGDFFRVISKREETENGSYVAGNGDDTPPSNYHNLTINTEYYKDFTDTEAPYGNGETVDFPIISILEISENTNKSDYPFGLPVSGEVEGGVFLEIDVNPENQRWGVKGIKTIREHILQNDTPPYSGFAGLFTGQVDGSPESGYMESNQYDNSHLDHNTLWRETFIDADYTGNRHKPLHRTSDWDKGVRGQIIKPKKHTDTKVYHEIGVFETMTDRINNSDHGTPVVIKNGYSWFRRMHSQDVFGKRKTIQVMPYLLDPSLGGVDSNYGTGTSRYDEASIFDGGRVRPVVDVDNPMCESFYTFPGSPEQIRDIGRLNVVSPEGERRRPASLIHSQFYGSETLYNTLSDFVATDFKDMNINDGGINALSPTDQYLTAFQSSKVSKVPVNRDILQTAGGNTSLTLSNQVLGAEVGYNGNFGVDTNQSAMLNVDGTLYFIDKNRRAICRISNNGFEVISNNQISEAIEDTFILDKASVKNYAIGYDRERDMVFFTFQDHETYGYHHTKKQWISRYSFKPLAYGLCEGDMLSFKLAGSDVGFRHNSTTMGAFYKINEKAEIKMISLHKNASAVKSYNALGLESSQALKTTVATENQNIIIDASDFKKKEDMYYAEITADNTNLKTAYKATHSSTDFQEKGHIFPIGKISEMNTEEKFFKIENMSRGPKPANQNRCLIYWDDHANKWISILRYYHDANGLVSVGFIEGSRITGATNDKIYAEGFFDDFYHEDSANLVGKTLAYIVTSNAAVGDTYSGTTVNQPYGGKRLRDFKATITIEATDDGNDFELYGVNVDADQSNLHM